MINTVSRVFFRKLEAQHETKLVCGPCLCIVRCEVYLCCECGVCTYNPRALTKESIKTRLWKEGAIFSLHFELHWVVAGKSQRQKSKVMVGECRACRVMSAGPQLAFFLTVSGLQSREWPRPHLGYIFSPQPNQYNVSQTCPELIT